MIEKAILYLTMESPKRLAPLLFENIKDDATFTDENCRKIYRAIKALHEVNRTPFLVRVIEATAATIDARYFTEMSRHTEGIGPNDEKFLLESIEELIWRRNKERILKEIYYEVKRPRGDSKRVIELANELKVSSTPREASDIETAHREYLEWITKKGGINSGFPTLDRLTDGFNTGELMIICGRPTTGKTMMALNMIDHIQGHALNRGGLFSIEMPKSAVIERMKQIHMDISRAELKTATETGTDHSEEFIDFYSDFQIYTKNYSVSQIREITEQEGLELVFIDFLNIVKPEIPGKRYERTTQIISDIKGMTKDLNVLAVVMAQLSRLAGDGSTPASLDALRDSGAIEEMGDFIIGLCRPEINPDINEKTKGELVDQVLASILKNKRGRGGKMRIHLDPKSGKMREIL